MPALPAALFAAAGASALFVLAERGLSRSGLLSIGAILGTVAGLVAVPPPGHHLVDVLRSGPPTNPYAVVAVMNGAMWGLVVAACAVPVTKTGGVQEAGAPGGGGAEGR